MRTLGGRRPDLSPCYRAPPPGMGGPDIMAAPDPLYDLMLLLDTAADTDRRAEILSNVEAAIAGAGTVVGKHDWGVRPTAYEIRHKADADYHLIQFQGPRELLERLDRTLRITDSVIRYRIIKLAPGTPDPPDLTSTAPATDGGTADSDAA